MSDATLSDYHQKWSNPYGPGELAVHGDTRAFDNRTFSISATPFKTSYDFSVFDHIKYLAISNQAFTVPTKGAVTFSTRIAATTPGTVRGYVVNGTYVATDAAMPLQGQQAGATLHMIDFATGQLFDWFVSGDTAFTLIERLPTLVTDPTCGADYAACAARPDYVGRGKMYTQIIDEVKIKPGVAHKVAITYTRTDAGSFVEYFLDDQLVSRADNVGVPLDAQGARYTGIYPSLGPGEILKDKVNSLVIGHGLFSLIDEFPFQHPEAPELNVSIPVQNRIFGQGAAATFDSFRVIVTEKK